MWTQGIWLMSKETFVDLNNATLYLPILVDSYLLLLASFPLGWRKLAFNFLGHWNCSQCLECRNWKFSFFIICINDILLLDNILRLQINNSRRSNYWLLHPVIMCLNKFFIYKNCRCDIILLHFRIVDTISYYSMPIRYG